MRRVLDGVIKDWGERLDYGRVKVVRVRNVRSGVSRADRPEPRPSEPATREKSLALSVTPRGEGEDSGCGQGFQRSDGDALEESAFSTESTKSSPSKAAGEHQVRASEDGFLL